jgi:hypothetical protein
MAKKKAAAGLPRYIVLAYEFRRHDRVYRRDEIHTFEEWPDDARAKDIQEMVRAEMIVSAADTDAAEAEIEVPDAAPALVEPAEIFSEPR